MTLVIDFMEQSSDQIKTKRITIWHYFIFTNIFILIILLFSSIANSNLLAYSYGWMIGMLASIFFLLINFFINKNWKISKRKKSKLIGTVYLVLFFKLAIFAIVFTPVLATNISEGTSWEKLNYPISGFMIILNYVIYNFFYVFYLYLDSKKAFVKKD